MRTLLAELLLPPMGAAVALAALLLLRPTPIRRKLALIALAILLLLGMPAISGTLLSALDPAPSSEATEPEATGPEVAKPGAANLGAAKPGAIVILSAEAVRVHTAQGLEPGLLTLERLRTGAALHRQTGLPILVSGGVWADSASTLAAMMARSLTDDFQTPVRWQEAASKDTWENATMSAAILKKEGISTVLLVTHGWHMRRSLMAFRQAGLVAIPAPVRPDRFPRYKLRDFVPRPDAWLESYYALHEWIGLAFYHFRG